MAVTERTSMAKRKAAQEITEPRVETVEEFLARGGKIQKIPYGQRSEDVVTKGWARGRKKKKKKDE